MDLQLNCHVEDLKEGSKWNASLHVWLAVNGSKRHNSVLDKLSLFFGHLHLFLLSLLLFLHVLFMLGHGVGYSLFNIWIVFKVVLLDGNLGVCEGCTVLHEDGVHD